MNNLFLGLAGLSGFLSVGLGAFAAHGLKERLSAEMLVVFQTGVQYHQIHSVALLVVAFFLGQIPSPKLKWAAWFFLGGIVVFSGSLYTLAVTEIRILGAITPFGGVGFILGWLCLAWAGLSRTQEQ